MKLFGPTPFTVLILCCLASFVSLPASAAPPFHPDCYQNCFRHYGEVTSVFYGVGLPDSLFVHNYATSQTARFTIGNPHDIGSRQISVGMWVVVEGQIAGVNNGCQVGVGVELRPTFIYRYNQAGFYWEVYDSGSGAWVRGW